MTPIIQPLPTEIIHLITAGEVIDSLAAVVRELVENALDAGANRIIISVSPEQWRVQVADNGIGMNLENLRKAACSHFTSKIHEIQDVWDLKTLGFRGEALHSLAQLSHLEIASRFSDSSENDYLEGWHICYNQSGEPISEKAMAIAPGTIVTVSNLFRSQPLRRTPELSPNQHLKNIQLTVQKIALCHPHITWQIRHQNTPILHISPGGKTQEIFPQILRGVRPADLQEITLKIPPSSEILSPSILQLVLGLPDRCHRPKPDWVKVAVNGRIVKIPELESTILTDLGRTCPPDRYPICFAHFHIHPQHIDWLRHPAKTEIYLQHLTYWQEQIKIGIDQAFRINQEWLLTPTKPEKVSQLLRASEKSGIYQTRSLNILGNFSPDPPESLLELRAIAQVNNTYIIAEYPQGMWLIEQHIAHERILYEKICDHWKISPLDSPIILKQLSTKQTENLQNIGIEIEAFGDQLWLIRSVPDALIQREDCPDALLELSLLTDLESVQVATACRSAIRNGTPLTLPEMQAILDQWQRTRKPRTCPHGRPIYLPLEESSLSRFFRRHWVIGKSHGI